MISHRRHSSIMSSATPQKPLNAAPSNKEEQPAKPVVRNKSRIPPEHPIELWEHLVGKKLIAEDADGKKMVTYDSTIGQRRFWVRQLTKTP